MKIKKTGFNTVYRVIDTFHRVDTLADGSRKSRVEFLCLNEDTKRFDIIRSEDAILYKKPKKKKEKPVVEGTDGSPYRPYRRD